MDKLQQIKDEYAREMRYADWDSIPDADWWNRIINDIAKRYARACCEATLKQAAENAECLPGGMYEASGLIDRKSILNPDNIVIL